MKILGIDYGLAKIGLAVAEDGLVQPLGVIQNDQRSLAKINRLMEEKEIEKVVVGVSQGKMGQKAKEYGQKMTRVRGCKVVYQDETLTTKEAIGKMIEVGKKKKYRQEKEDAFAAAIILQAYLERDHV
ncbi:MAG: Holliday junction resolvase RuvX [Candidatus Marinimicrobia bacterium]|nr:Holliday junction resolvase RuvX [Candidatus Neomarinimicrobiota bacterium]